MLALPEVYPGKIEGRCAELQAAIETTTSAIKDALEIQLDTVKIRQKYWKKFRRIVPAKKAARFYQLENKMDAEVEYVLAGGIPLVETN